MELDHLPIIDWDLALKLVNNKKDLAEEILQLLVRDLEEDVSVIKELRDSENHLRLIQRVHRLHGALCYSGLPRLKAVISHLEKELKSESTSNLPMLFEQLDTEVTLLLKQYSDWQK